LVRLVFRNGHHWHECMQANAHCGSPMVQTKCIGMLLVGLNLPDMKAKNHCQNMARATVCLLAPELCCAINENYLVGATFGATAKSLFKVNK
jgi:hypothetical protein